jgi:hypothetical protein
MSADLEGRILDTPAMDPSTPSGSQSRLIWSLTKNLNIRGGKQMHELSPLDFSRTTLSLDHPTHPGYKVLEYLESLSKTNQGGLKSAVNGPPRKNPRFFLSPTATDIEKLNNPVHLFDIYTARTPSRERATQFFLTPFTSTPAVRFLSLNIFAEVCTRPSHIYRCCCSRRESVPIPP